MYYKIIKINIFFQLKIHSNYNKSAYVDLDAGLIKLSRDVYFQPNNYIAPICLPKVKKSFAGEMAIATGWGATSNGKIYFKDKFL